MTNRKDRGRPPYQDILTPAEWKVAEAVRHGLSNPKIAQKQGVSLNAVKFHVTNILAKLSLETRNELQKWDGIRRDSPLSKIQAPPKDINLNSVGQIARFVTNIADATLWYRDVLGLTHLYSFGDLSFFDCDGTRLFLSAGNPKTNSIIYFNVDDIHQAHKAFIKRGVEIVSAPHMIHQHEDGTEDWMAFLKDLDGQPLGLMARAYRNSGNAEMADKK